jgi:hypothetical protein
VLHLLEREALHGLLLPGDPPCHLSLQRMRSSVNNHTLGCPSASSRLELGERPHVRDDTYVHDAHNAHNGPSTTRHEVEHIRALRCAVLWRDMGMGAEDIACGRT